MTALPVRYSALAAIRYGHRRTNPPGANNWDEPGSGMPVILLHGLGANMATNWYTLSPLLVNAGYAVFALNFGQYGHGFFTRSRPGVGDLTHAADELDDLVTSVLAATGATRVALVGHSVGGLLAQYYVKRRDGAARVSHVIGLAPTVHGTTFNGLLRVGMFRRIGARLVGANIAQQAAGSAFLADLYADGDTAPGVEYTVISPHWDVFTTPLRTQRVNGPTATNVRLRGLVDHIFIAFNATALDHVLTGLRRRS